MPKHNFYLLDFEKGIEEVVENREMEHVDLDDELVLYFRDFFNWVKVRNAGHHEQSGLDYYGFSEISGAELELFSQIISKLIDLFELAPDYFTLYGLYSPDDEKYERNPFRKVVLLKTLRNLLAICQKARTENKKILHWGI